ncbi:unnamed protein product [Phytophthora fragariaefolia]|uniref:Unnamed protein product n=1 Tax=Phytophthora fragariaefolia TaxID=1490495 RepID=A0A9W6TLW1_9STRA|nr:unnamed protein product [Phytophthora fragariaefolia]
MFATVLDVPMEMLGEVLPSSVSKMLEAIGPLGEKEIFLDVGAGVGNNLAQVALMMEVRICDLVTLEQSCIRQHLKDHPHRAKVEVRLVDARDVLLSSQPPFCEAAIGFASLFTTITIPCAMPPWSSAPAAVNPEWSPDHGRGCLQHAIQTHLTDAQLPISSCVIGQHHFVISLYDLRHLHGPSSVSSLLGLGNVSPSLQAPVPPRSASLYPRAVPPSRTVSSQFGVVLSPLSRA